MTRLERARRAGAVIRAFLEDKAARLLYGRRVRKAIMKRIKGGEQPEGNYRIEWLNTTTIRVMGLLKEAKHDFEGRYPWDALSDDDFEDVLRSCMNQLEGT